MDAVTAQQIQRIDQLAIEKYGIPSVVLMENAGRALAEAIRQRQASGTVIVLCGTGNNGGDGFVAARHLVQMGFDVQVVVIGHEGQLKPDARINFNILQKLKYPLVMTSHISPGVITACSAADVIVDAIFGVGLNRNIGEPYAAFIKAINDTATFTVAADIPSGLDATTGQIYGCCVRADQTVTFSRAKQGCLREAGPRYSGKLNVADIGIPLEIQKSVLKS